MTRLARVGAMALGGSVCGCFAGLLLGAVLGLLFGLWRGDVSLGLSGALLGYLLLGLAGAAVGALLGLRDAPGDSVPTVARKSPGPRRPEPAAEDELQPANTRRHP
jgi:hypothetical protein